MTGDNVHFEFSCKTNFFSGHAIQRMFERGFSKSDIRTCVEQGEVIESYPNDTPYPSVLLLGSIQGRPVHIVLAVDAQNETCIIVTAYEPNINLWKEGFKKRRSS
ncbi:MAG: DUF4258 domain-containing protein [Desulfobacteraceae bacterium]|nr:MAG: DUF4258 domain-containing protein [Desulfobacteraceae bacterium]